MWELVVRKILHGFIFQNSPHEAERMGNVIPAKTTKKCWSDNKRAGEEVTIYIRYLYRERHTQRTHTHRSVFMQGEENQDS
jgi:hypothetical protein